MVGSYKRKLKKKAKAKALQAAAGSSPEPPFQKNEQVLCGKKVEPDFTAAQLEFIQRHCFSCSTEFADSKQLDQHIKNKHSNEKVNKKCSICQNMFRCQTGQHEVHYLKMSACWRSFSED